MKWWKGLPDEGGRRSQGTVGKGKMVAYFEDIRAWQMPSRCASFPRGVISDFPKI